MTYVAPILNAVGGLTPTTSVEQEASADQDYRQHVEEIITSLLKNHSIGLEITADHVVIGLTPDRHENAKVRDFAFKVLKISASDFRAAMRRHRIKTALGTVPRTPYDLVEHYTKENRVVARYNGVLVRDAVPFMEIDGRRYYDLSDIAQFPGAQIELNSRFKGSLQPSEMAEDLRVLSTNLELGFSDGAINDAVSKWCRDTKPERLGLIYNHIDGEGLVTFEQAERREKLFRLVEACFDTTDTSAEFVMAVLMKFMWQVKRKMRGLPVTDHLMPVILGRQGGGKSTFVRKMLAPVEEVTAPADFKQITDERNISLWKNFVIFADEMSKAAKSDIDAIKTIITATTLTRRPMRMNHTEEVPQNVTFIGTANAQSLAELIRDPTGTRRFISLRFADRADWELLNQFQWEWAWHLVDAAGPDPMAEFTGHLTDRQEDDREKSRIEVWLSSIDPAKFISGALYERDAFRAAELYGVFREFEDSYFPGSLKTDVTRWGNEMAAIEQAGRSPFKKKRARNGMVYLWTADKPLRLVRA